MRNVKSKWYAWCYEYKGWAPKYTDEEDTQIKGNGRICIAMSNDGSWLEWGGAEPLPRASFLRREKGGATEDSVLCVCLCVRIAETKKWKSRDFPHFGLKMVIFAFASAKSQKSEILWKSVQKAIFAILAPKSLNKRQGFPLFLASCLPKAGKSQK